MKVRRRRPDHRRRCRLTGSDQPKLTSSVWTMPAACCLLLTFSSGPLLLGSAEITSVNYVRFPIVTGCRTLKVCSETVPFCPVEYATCMKTFLLVGFSNDTERNITALTLYHLKKTSCQTQIIRSAPVP